jgi:hypothetical protein
MLVRPDLSLDTKVNVAVDVLSDIRGYHSGERLADRTKCILHCSSSDGVLAGGNTDVMVALAKDLQDGDWVFPGPKERVDSILRAKIVPALRMLVLDFGALKSESRFDLLVNSA